MPSVFNHVAILGLGLIGGSLARVISEKKLAARVTAYDQSQETIEYALSQHFIHHGGQQIKDIVSEADLVILATPVDTFAGLTQEISGYLKPGAIVTDVASVKRLAVSGITTYLPVSVPYVPAHPIAGSEQTGVKAADAKLFSGKKVILTPQEAELESEPVARMQAFWKKAGARVEFMPPDLHDVIYAYVSHLPQVVAFAIGPLLNFATKNNEYKRFTRLMKSSSGLWVGICMANADYVSDAVSDFMVFFGQIYGELKENTQDNGDDKAEIQPLFAGLISACLIATASVIEEKLHVNPMPFAGSGFADMTAMSASDPQVFLASVSANSQKLTPLLEKTLLRLQEVREALTECNDKRLLRLFAVEE